MKNISIDIADLCSKIDELGSFSAHLPPAVTRVLFSKQDQDARIWIMKIAKAMGLKSRVDNIGNIFMRWEGEDKNLPAIGTGSHTDAIPNAGKFDGVVGVLGPLEAIKALDNAGFKPKRSIEVLMFSSEEPTRFGIGCLGSRLLSGTMEASKAVCLKDENKKSLPQWLKEIGYSRGLAMELETVELDESYYKAFLELHIEQGPILERENIDIGIVKKIAAPSSFKITLNGSGGHAGAVLMSDRKDALLAASEISLAVEKHAINSDSEDTVGTTGVLNIKPNAINSIPYQAYLEIDFRDTDKDARDKALMLIKQDAIKICEKRHIKLTWEWINQDEPAYCDKNLIDDAQKICKELDYSHIKMISRAYHDSLFMAKKYPLLMTFIPCFKGYSHRPDEYVSPENLEIGVTHLAHMLAKLSSE